MVQVSVDEIKRDLSAYLQRVEAGETVIIVEADKPIAEIKPVLRKVKALHGIDMVRLETVNPALRRRIEREGKVLWNRR